MPGSQTFTWIGAAAAVLLATWAVLIVLAERLLGRQTVAPPDGP